MNRRQLEAQLDVLFSREFPKSGFLSRLLKQHLSDEGRQDMARRRQRLQAQEKALADRRARVIESFFDGTITKQDRDRHLDAVNNEREAIGRELAELKDTLMPGYAEWELLFRPFRKGFRGQPAEERRRLITSRFQEIRVRNYQVVSLYLLTGEVAAPRPIPLVELPDGTKCYECGRELRYEWEKNRYEHPYCEGCVEVMAAQEEWEERMERRELAHSEVLHAAAVEITDFSDSSQRL